jgi:DTW domain-containing protein YfiP
VNEPATTRTGIRARGLEAFARAAPTERAMCRRCRRPASVCWCAALTSIDTATRVVIVQHPRESDMPIGTARMAALCLPNATLHVGVRWDDSPELRAALSDPARPPILLWPGEGARDILTDPPAGPVTLVVVDGTWSQAKTIVRDNPVLAALPRYAFTAPEPTIYRIRREPRAEYVSTIEALMHVLGALEGDPDRFRALLDPMHAMVEAQLEHTARSRRPRARRPRPKSTFASRLPAAVTERFGDVVCVAGEANAWPRLAAGPEYADELVHWVAHRPATGETFDVVAAPQNPLCRSTPSHLELGEARLAAGVAREELFAAFARFLRPSDVVCAWGPYSPQLYERSGGTLPADRCDLRLAAKRLEPVKTGSLDQYAARTAPSASAAPAGRAARRAAMLVRIVAAWRTIAGIPD